MQIDSANFRKLMSKDLVDVLIRVGLIAFVVIMCVQVFSPFAGLIIWALILAVSIYPLHQRLAVYMGGRQGYAATTIVLIGLLLIGVPTLMLGSSFVTHIHSVYEAFENNTVEVSPPDPGIADWPVIGPRLYEKWNAAATDMPAFLKKLQPQLGKFARSVLSITADTAGGVLLFLGSLIIAGIMMAYGKSGSESMLRISKRLAGQKKGGELHILSTATIRSVSTGVIGVAFIQALLLGVGFIIAGIPAAGVLAVIVLLLGIMQLPAALVSLPAIAYLWWSGDSSTTFNIILTIYLVVAGLADGLLKPLLLGRGVNVPMPVILLGALGGMVSAGIIGLFIGAVLLAVGYQIFMDWVDEEQPGGGGEAEPVATAGASLSEE